MTRAAYILSEDIDIPGYNEDPGKFPPYTEDLGNGATHEVGADGVEHWRLNGKLHRIGGPAVTGPDGFEIWHKHGKLHRVGGPAVIDPGVSREWWRDGKRHRADGPAIINDDGTKSWWRNGVEIGAYAEHEPEPGI